MRVYMPTPQCARTRGVALFAYDREIPATSGHGWVGVRSGRAQMCGIDIRSRNRYFLFFRRKFSCPRECVLFTPPAAVVTCIFTITLWVTRSDLNNTIQAYTCTPTPCAMTIPRVRVYEVGATRLRPFDLFIRKKNPRYMIALQKLTPFRPFHLFTRFFHQFYRPTNLQRKLELVVLCFTFFSIIHS